MNKKTEFAHWLQRVFPNGLMMAIFSNIVEKLNDEQQEELLEYAKARLEKQEEIL